MLTLICEECLLLTNALHLVCEYGLCIFILYPRAHYGLILDTLYMCVYFGKKVFLNFDWQGDTVAMIDRLK